MMEIEEVRANGVMLAEHPEVVRPMASELLRWAMPCDEGDDKFKVIAGDYGGGGTTCGFLCHWLMWALGCRDNKTINRTDHDDNLKYINGKNVSKIRWGGYFKTYAHGTIPEIGDVMFISNGPPLTEHVLVFLDEEDGIWTTADGGQRNNAGKQAMRVRRRKMLPNGQLENFDMGENKNPRTLQGWIPLDTLPFTKLARLP